MSRSNLDKSQAQTENTVNSIDSLDYEEPKEKIALQMRKVNVLSIVFSVVMTIISGLLLKQHSKGWKKWTTALSVAYFALVRSSLKSEGGN